MDKLTVNEVKTIAFDILTHIDKVCKNNNIEYYLFFGTLLGAVRHKGFIPWDDDIDIVVPVDKYEELCTLLSNQGNRYKVFSSKLNGDYPYSFAKCVDTETLIYEKGLPPIQDLGIYVDIFPLYQCPEGRFGSKVYTKRLDILHKLSWQGDMKELSGPEAVSRKEKMLRVVASTCNWRRIHRKMTNDKVRRKRWSYCVKTISSIKVFPKECFTPRIQLPFEGGMFSAPGDYDKVLKLIYKDYMEMPPVEKRVIRHGFEAYRK